MFEGYRDDFIDGDGGTASISFGVEGTALICPCGDNCTCANCSGEGYGG